MKDFLRHRALNVMTLSIIAAGALFAQPVFALLTGTATSTSNTVTAVGADIQIDGDGNGTFGTSETGSLTAQFTASPQGVLAGFIDVQNPAGGTQNWQFGYDLVNAPDPAPSASPNTTLNSALKVRIEIKPSGACAQSPNVNDLGFTGPANNEGAAVVVENAAWVGTLITDRTPLNNTTSGAQQERLCFYLALPAGSDNAAGGSISYKLTFTAN